MQTWLRLKLDLLPCISQEADKAANDYNSLIERFRRGDKEVIQDILLLQASIRARIDEFDRFYEQNFSDPRIAYFERTKMKLRKILYTPVEAPEQEQATQAFHHHPQEIEQYEEDPHYEESKEEHHYTSPSTHYQARDQYEPRNQTRTGLSKPERGVPAKSPAQKSKSPNPGSRNVGGAKGVGQKTVGSTKKQSAQENDVTFTIKMTKKEYEQYLQTMKLKKAGR